MLDIKYEARSSLSISLAVWRALVLREALTRISGGRYPWVWLLLEPMAHMAFVVFLFDTIRHRVIGGIDTALWVMVGMLTFFFFRRVGLQSLNSISVNDALFTYRQVRPVDTILARAILEAALMILIAILVLAGAALFGKNVLPANPLLVFAAVFGVWLFGLGFGLTFSVPSEISPEFEKVLQFVMMPIYLITGVIFPLSIVPYPYRDWLLLNPLVHGLEAARLGFADHYHAIPELDLAYLYAAGALLVTLGLMLQLRFVQRLIAK